MCVCISVGLCWLVLVSCIHVFLFIDVIAWLCLSCSICVCILHYLLDMCIILVPLVSVAFSMFLLVTLSMLVMCVWQLPHDFTSYYPRNKGYFCVCWHLENLSASPLRLKLFIQNVICGSKMCELNAQKPFNCAFLAMIRMISWYLVLGPWILMGLLGNILVNGN